MRCNAWQGVLDFVSHNISHVDEMVIVDTGSTDGTRECLEELKGRHNNLKVYDTRFTGFSDARNYGLKRVQTKRALVLDADERLSNEDYRKLGMLVNDCHTNWGLGLIDIYPDGKVANFFTHNPRIFDVTFWTKYIGDVDEYLTGYNKKTAWIYLVSRSSISGLQQMHYS